ncbi:MAG: TIGR03067 domain-containing protein [Pirellulaceae bacterium]|jgi:uncharacterized protein (TIGR03067 family)|nr:TIGR03067 domain-containing protein [Pirellulaceae bacterium]
MSVNPFHRSIGVLVVALLTLCSAMAVAQPPDEAAERARFVGVWKGFAVHGRGERPNEGPVQLELTITERTIRGIQVRGSDRMDHGQGEYVLRMGANPKHLDAAKTAERGRSQAYVGIYRLEGDTLYWCVSPQKQRPKTFETQKGQFLLILHRDPTERR